MMYKYHILAGLLAGIFILGGCSTPTADAPSNIISPVSPLSDQKIPRNWYLQWAQQRDIADKIVKDVVFLSSSKGRDWRDPSGPDGCLIRVILLDADGNPVYVPGRIRAFLIKDPDRNDASVISGWQIGPNEAQHYYDDNDFSGYVLPLDWGQGPESSGLLMLVVRWESPDGRARLTRNSIFEENIVAETSTYSRPVGGAGNGTGGSTGAADARR